MVLELERQRTRIISGVSVERDEALRFTRYSTGGDLADSVDIYVVDEVRDLGLPFGKLRSLVTSEINRVSKNPFGPTNVDPDMDDDAARRRRAINKLEEVVEKEIGLPIAIKSAGTGLEDNRTLVDQFLVMRELQVSSEERLAPRGDTIQFLPVYGAIRAGGDEFLVMKYVRGQQMQDHEVPYLTYGWAGSGDPISEPAIKPEEYPDFLSALGVNPLGEEFVRWRTITPVFEELMGAPLNDLAGRNILVDESRNKRKFVVIDQIRGNID